MIQMIDRITDDMKCAFRALVTKPGFALVVVLTLALGIGANTAIFSLVDAVLFRPLPVREPERVVRVFASDEKGQDLSNSSYPVFTDYRDQAKSFAGLAAYSNWNAVDLSVKGQKPERVHADLVSGNYFQLLGLLPETGRFFAPEDDRVSGNHSVMVLSHRFWQSRFAGNLGVLGSTVQINGHPFTIIGVTRPEFFGIGLDGLPEMWIPISSLDEAQPDWAGALTERRMSWVEIIGRLKPDVTMSQAQAELRTIASVRASTQEKNEQDPSAALMTARDAATQWDLLPSAPTISWALMGVVLLVLLISCAVTAGLFLVRAEQRQREIVVRLAIGAPRSRIIRQLLIESLLLSFLAALAGLLFAGWTTDLLIAISPAQFPLPLDAASPIVDLRVLLFTMSVSTVAGLLFGLSPAIHASRFDLMASLKSQITFAGSSRLPLQSLVVIAQVALTAILLMGAGLLMRTLWKANQVNPGFSADHALVMSLDLAKEGYTQDTGRLFYEQLQQQSRGISRVSSVAVARTVPVQNSGMRVSIEIDGQVARNPADLNVDFNIVSPGYFKTLSIPILVGRDFEATDTATAPVVAIVNRAMAERFWPGQNAVGKILKNIGAESQPAEIVGVVGDVRYRSLRTPAAPMVYVTPAQRYMPSMTLVVRTTGDPGAVLPELTAVVSRLNNKLPLFAVSTLREKLGVSLAQERMIAGLFSAFGLLALLLAAIGLYAVVSHATQRRTREFGIRMALGAARREVLSLVLSRGVMLTVVGLIFGLACATGLARLITSLLFGVSPADPVTFAGIVILLGGISLLACGIPAMRATRVDPTDALRYE